MKKPLKIALWIADSLAGLVAIAFGTLIAVGFFLLESF
jgi:hypothetical protein